MLRRIKAIVRNVCVITDGHKGDGQNTALVAENGNASTKRQGDLFFAHQATHVFVYAEILDLISRMTVTGDDVAYYFISVKIHPYGVFVNIFHAL